MKVKTKHIRLGILGLLFLIVFSTQLFSNLWQLLTGNGYIIPKESSIISFESTMMNFGSGDYWLYGEDNTNYYTTLLNIEAGYSAKYFLISKEKARKLSGFKKFHYSTWFDVNVECGDLLKKYAQKPKQLEFVKCERKENSQTIVEVTYRVKGGQSKEVEDFLVKNYGMGKLKWVCCGWENSGKYGGFEHSEFKKIHPFLMASVDMWASGEVEDKNGIYVGLEFDRDKIEYFYVTINLSIV